MPFDVELPNGMRVACLQKHEVLLVNREVESYFADGFDVAAGDTIFDVGANIGLFSLAACARAGGGLRVFAFEPIRPLFELLRLNIDRHGFADQVEALDFGLSAEAKSVEFAFYPDAPVLSTAYPDEASDKAVMRDAVLNSIMYLDEAPAALKAMRWLPAGVRRRLVELGLDRTLRPQTAVCRLRTISDFLRERRIESIDYLKIDVERAELDVVNGIAADDWPKVRKAVVEVHDIEDRLRTVTTLLEQRGLDQLSVSRAPTLEHTNIFVVFAKRAETAGA